MLYKFGKWMGPLNLHAFDNWLWSTSLPTLGSVLVLGFGLAFIVGRFMRRKSSADHHEADTLLISAVLGLLALMLGFTYSLAVDRYETRRLLVQEEANAIGTMYLRAQLLEQPWRSEISRILIEYTDNRIALGEARRGEIPPLLARNNRLLGDFWAASAAAFPSIRELDFSGTFYDSVNLVIDLDATRKSARLAHVPPVIFLLLFMYIGVTAGLLGFFADGRTGIAQSCVFLALLVSFLLVIFDIDQPSLGGIRESQAPMERMRASLPP